MLHLFYRLLQMWYPLISILSKFDSTVLFYPESSEINSY